MKICCLKGNQQEESSPAEKSVYDNVLLAVLFPLTFFTTVVGVTFLTWPLTFHENVKEAGVSSVFIVGIFLACVAAVSAFTTIVTVCYIHRNNFERRRLPYKIAKTINSDDIPMQRQSRRTKNPIVPMITVVESDSKTASSNQNMTITELYAHSDGRAQSKTAQEALLYPKIKCEFEGIDNHGANVYETIPSRDDFDSIVVYRDSNRRPTPLGQLNTINSEETHL